MGERSDETETVTPPLMPGTSEPDILEFLTISFRGSPGSYVDWAVRRDGPALYQISEMPRECGWC